MPRKCLGGIFEMWSKWGSALELSDVETTRKKVGEALHRLPSQSEMKLTPFFLGNLSFEGRKGGWRIIAIAHFLQKYFHLWVCWRQVLPDFCFPPNSYPPPHPTSQDILDWWKGYRIEDARGITDIQYLNRKEKSQCEGTTGNWKQILDGTLLF